MQLEGIPHFWGARVGQVTFSGVQNCPQTKRRMSAMLTCRGVKEKRRQHTRFKDQIRASFLWVRQAGFSSSRFVSSPRVWRGPGVERPRRVRRSSSLRATLLRPAPVRHPGLAGGSERKFRRGWASHLIGRHAQARCPFAPLFGLGGFPF